MTKKPIKMNGWRQPKQQKKMGKKETPRAKDHQWQQGKSYKAKERNKMEKKKISTTAASIRECNIQPKISLLTGG